jgi:hypothetical protein
VTLHGAIKASEVEAEIRREYRTIGANQELVGQANSRSHHLQRAVLGALIALLVLAVLFMFAGSATAAPAVPRPIVVLLDLTASTSPEHFVLNKATIREAIRTLAAGQRFVVLGIADSFGQTEVLLDAQLPSTDGYLGLEIKAARERLAARWDQASTTVALKYKQTDVIGALSLLQHAGELAGKPMILILLTDLRQSVHVDLERPSTIDVAGMLEKARKKPGLPDLAGAEVHLLGVSPAGKSIEYFAQLREFWLQFFAAARARVRTFSVDRRLPDLAGAGQ